MSLIRFLLLFMFFFGLLMTTFMLVCAIVAAKWPNFINQADFGFWLLAFYGSLPTSVLATYMLHRLWAKEIDRSESS